jgi:hypothetical protein
MENTTKSWTPHDKPGLFPEPPVICPQPTHIVHFNFWVGDQVTVNGMDWTGLITAAAVNHTGGKMYLVDRGKDEKWIAENFLIPNYGPFYRGGQGPLPPAAEPKEED